VVANRFSGCTARRLTAVVLAACAGISLGSCGEAERRADRVSDLRKQAERGLTAVERFCEERALALDRFREDEPGWERALEEVLRATDPLTDYCETEHAGHDHGEPLEGGFRRPPPDTT
jgi:hypothetical protein